PVEARLAVVLRYAPFGCDVALLLQLEQRRIQRAVVNRQPAAARLLDPAGDAVAVQRPERLEGFQAHQRERPAPDVGRPSHDPFRMRFLYKYVLPRIGMQYEPRGAEVPGDKFLIPNS